MKKFGVIALSLCTLSGCTNITTVKNEQTIESISTLLFDQDKNIIYAVGNEFDYQVSPCASAFGKLIIDQQKIDEACLKTFLYALEHKNLMIDSTLDFKIQTGQFNQVFGYYQTYYKNDEHITNSNQPDKIIERRKLNSFELNQLNKKLDTSYTTDQIYKLHTWITGKTVELKNKNELLALGQLKTPMQIKVTIQQQKKSLTLMPIVKATGAIALVPIGLVLMLPYTALIGYCESGHSC